MDIRNLDTYGMNLLVTRELDFKIDKKAAMFVGKSSFL